MKKKYVMLVFTSLLISSCAKKVEVPEPKVELSQKKPKKTFASLEDFNSYLEKYNDNVSFRNSAQSEIYAPVEMLVEDDAFASVFNEDAEVSIADVTYKVTNVGTFFSLNEQSENMGQYISVNEDLINQLPQPEPDEEPIPEFLIAAQPNLNLATLVDEEDKIFYLGNGVYYKDGIEENLYDNAPIDHIDDADSPISPLIPSSNTPSGNSTSANNSTSFSYSNYFAPSVFEGLDFSNAKVYTYTQKNGEVLNDFGSKDRLVVQLKAKNFLIFSYVKASVRIDHKKKYWFGWRTLQNYDELRAGFVNLTLDYNLPSFANLPNNTPKNPLDNGANPYLKKFFTIKIDDDPFDLYRLTDILSIPNLPYNIRNIVEDFLNNPQSVYSDLLNKQKNNAIQTLTNYVKSQLGNNITTSNRFSFAIPSNNYITIPLIEKKKTSTGAKIEYTFGFQTMMIGVSGNSINNLNINAKPSNTPKIISGAAFGAGKLNGVWKTSVLVKNKS
ncbi:hypothetical protein [Sphingobacterium sp. R2]|uniref:hypothetical protein n=1 Tax=Sphingobacterium sp. R2 TaxID=3112958 RepID=UPI00345D4AE1